MDHIDALSNEGVLGKKSEATARALIGPLQKKGLLDMNCTIESDGEDGVCIHWHSHDMTWTIYDDEIHVSLVRYSPIAGMNNIVHHMYTEAQLEYAVEACERILKVPTFTKEEIVAIERMHEVENVESL